MNLNIDLSEERVRALEARALECGVSAEQYAQRVLERDLELRPAQSVSEMMREIWADMPVEVRAKLPRDGASQVDHYVYGLPKRGV